MRRKFLGRWLARMILICLGVSAGHLSHAAPAMPRSVPALTLVVLGSGGPGAAGRAGASFVVLVDGEPRILVDAGGGSFVRLGEAKLNLRNLDIVLLTHLHVDHTADLPAIVKARAVSQRVDLDFHVFGPAASVGQGPSILPRFPATSTFIDRYFGKYGLYPYLTHFVRDIRFHVEDVALEHGSMRSSGHVIYKEGDLSIRAAVGHHGDAPAVLYRIDYRGRSITFSGDADDHAHDALARLAMCTDLLVFNAVILDPPQPSASRNFFHSTPRDIGRVATRAGVGRLLLAHIPQDVERSARAVRASISSQYPGPVEFAGDGMIVSLDADHESASFLCG